jgi:hypothetical protein
VADFDYVVVGPSITTNYFAAPEDMDAMVVAIEAREAAASVFPAIPHGNTHAPAVMVGEKAADLIRASG